MSLSELLKRGVQVKAKVLTNNGKRAVLKPLDGTGSRTKMFRTNETRDEFMEMFPPGQEVELTRISDASAEALAAANAQAEAGNIDLDRLMNILNLGRN